MFEIFARRRVTQKEQEIIWQAMAAICWRYLQRKQGAFYELKTFHDTIKGLSKRTDMDR